MTAYLIARIRVTDPEAYKEYMKLSPAAIAKYSGRFLVRGGRTETLEGREEERRVVVVAFPDMDTARAFYESEEYRAARAARAGAAEADFLIVEGLEEPA